MARPKMDSDALTLGDVAKMLGVNASTPRLWVKTGELAAEKRGTRWIVTREGLEAFMQARRLRPNDTIAPRLLRSFELIDAPEPEPTAVPAPPPEPTQAPAPPLVSRLVPTSALGTAAENEPVMLSLFDED